MEKLKNPPIKEAILQVSFSFPENKEMNFFDPFVDILKPKYPTKKETVAFKVALPNNIEESQKSTFELSGYIFLNEESNELVQFSKNSIAFNRKKPYTSWDEIFERFLTIWTDFQNLYPEVQINVLSLRYLNIIDLTIREDQNINQYFKLYPNIPDEISKIPPQHLLQVQIPNTDNTLLSNITHSFRQCENVENLVHFTLDIEVNTTGEIKRESLKKIFQQMREVKNNIFFNSITENTKKTFNG